ncbi:S41 family peptidase [Inquilinus sp. CAU 1745]|uniref:S41 family peptidase n=1 Tax=Inquilinus sp. CAU 1745 TaxID=3140369 RepID=UPI00325AFC36
MKKLQVAAIALAAALAGVPALVIAQSEPSENPTDDRLDTYRQLDLFGEVFERVRADYVEEVTDKQLIEAAINGMLTSLDPHSSYLNEESFQDMQVQTRGAFGGLGIEVTMENGVVKVVSPIDDTPAFRAGLQAGDLITHLDGEPVMGLTLNDAVDKMRGAVGSDLTVTIQRGEQEPFDVTLTRDVIRVESIRSEVIEDVGYIRITSFTEQTMSGLEEAMATIDEETGDALLGYVVDLRNNPGGLLDQAVAVSDAFLEQGEIVSTRSEQHPDRGQRWNATEGDLADGLPVIVLINGGSASASEIVAGALQDHHRAVIMGTQSFGKGSVQTIMPLPGNGAMRLTTARYFTPSGRSIQAMGIEPDIIVEQARLEEIQAGIARREADLRGALDNNQVPLEDEPDDNAVEEGDPAANDNAPAEGEDEAPAGEDEAVPVGEDMSEVPPEGEEEPFDYQLDRAIDLLRGISLFSEQRAAN